MAGLAQAPWLPSAEFQGLGALDRRPPPLGRQLVPAGVLTCPRRSRHQPANCARPPQASAGVPRSAGAPQPSLGSRSSHLLSSPQSQLRCVVSAPGHGCWRLPAGPTVGSLWVSAPAPDGSCLRQLPAALSSQPVGTPVRDPGLPVHLENPSSSFKAHVRRHFLPEPSLVQATRINHAHPCLLELTRSSHGRCISAGPRMHRRAWAGPGELGAWLAGGFRGRRRGRALSPLCELSEGIGDVSPVTRSRGRRGRHEI